MKLSSLWSMYKKDKAIAGYSTHTLKAYELQFKLLINHIGEVDIDSIACAQLKDYLYANIHLKPASLGHRVRFMRSFFKWANSEGYSTNNPAEKIKEPKVKDKTPKYLSDEEVSKLINSCETPLEETILWFLYSTGCRIGEISKIDKCDINWDNNSIIVAGKGGKSRTVYFDDKCKDILSKYLNSRNDTERALISTERVPHRMSVAQIRCILKRISLRSGITNNIYPHKLRHSYATHLLNNGAPIEAIRELLGHCNIDSTLIYARLTEQGKKNIYNKCFNNH